MNIKVIMKSAMVMAVLLITCAGLVAQPVRNDVVKAYNEGVNAMQTDVGAAIRAFENSIGLADQVGAEAADLKEKAVKVLPGLYVKVANTALAEKKPAAEVIKLAKAAAAVSEKYNNANGKENSAKLLVQGYNNLAAGYFTKNDYANALVTFDSLLAINPNFNTAIYNKAMIYMRQDNVGSFEQAIDLYIEKLRSVNDEEKASKAARLALEYFRAAGSKANQTEKLPEALALLDKAAKYGDDKDLFYFYADVYNKQKNYDNGLIYAQKGLDMETGEAEAKAKFYYQLGVAHSGKGMTAEACASFKNSLYGPFLEASKAQRTNMKCEQ